MYRPNKYGITISSDTCLSILALFVWTESIIVTYVKAALSRITSVDFAANTVSLIFILLSIGSLSAIVKRIKTKDIFVSLLFLGTYYLTAMENNSVRQYLLDNQSRFIISCAAVYFIGLSLDNNAIEKFYYGSVISIYFDIYYVFAIGIGKGKLGDDNLTVAYELLPHVCLVACNYLSKGKKIDIITMLIGIFIILSMGSRGPIIGISVLIVFYLLIIKKMNNKFLKITGISIMVSVVAYVFMSNIDLLMNSLSKLGLSSRTLYKIVNGNFFQSAGRDSIREVIIDAIKEKPLLGYGMAADRGFGVTYAHNILLELWVSYGIVIGSLILFVILKNIVVAYIKSKNDILRDFLIVLFFSTGFFKLLLSSSYLREPNFYMLIGLSLNIIRLNKEDEIEKDSE